MNADPVVSGLPSGVALSVSSIVGTVPAPATGRGLVVELGKATAVQLNTIAATTIFTTPAVGGFTRCRVLSVVIGNISAVASTASVSFGQSATPTDWAATAAFAGLTAVGQFVEIVPSVATGSKEITATGISFVANVTVPQGVATTADITALGYYE
jgi:hypothetical protein